MLIVLGTTTVPALLTLAQLGNCAIYCGISVVYLVHALDSRCVYRCAQSEVCVAVCVAKATSVMSYEDLCAAFLHFRKVPGAGGVTTMHEWLRAHSELQAQGNSISGFSQNVLVRLTCRQWLLLQYPVHTIYCVCRVAKRRYICLTSLPPTDAYQYSRSSLYIFLSLKTSALPIGCSIMPLGSAMFA